MPHRLETITRVTCYLDGRQDLYALSKLCTGLCLLAARGEIRVRFARPPAGRGFLCAWGATTLAVETGGVPARLAAIDLYDRGDVFERELLEACAIYLKRSYYAAAVADLPRPLGDKVAPFGLNYACRVAGARVPAAVAPPFLRRFAGDIRGGRASLAQAIRDLKRFATAPEYRRFEHEPPLPLEPQIVFQTRVWLPGDSNTDDMEAFNESRVALVRALRKSFPKRFRGGIVPTALARERYGDALASEPSRPGQYLEASKTSLIGISTRGLHRSTPFKLPEYLAGSKCIVAEPLRNQLPVPLANGRELVEFSSVDECLSICDQLLSRPDRACELRHAAWEYYRAQAEPAAHLRNCLARIMAPYIPPARTQAAFVG